MADGKLFEVIVKQSIFRDIKRSLYSKNIIHSINMHLSSAKTIFGKRKVCSLKQRCRERERTHTLDLSSEKSKYNHRMLLAWKSLEVKRVFNLLQYHNMILERCWQRITLRVCRRTIIKKSKRNRLKWECSVNTISMSTTLPADL